MDGSRISILNSLQCYLAETWAYRHFWWSLVRIDLRNRYKRSVLGIGWSLLQPLAMTAVLCIAFRAIFKVETSEYVPLLLTGMACWTFITASLTEGSHAFYNAQGFIRSERLPLAVYPLRVVIGAFFHFGIMLSLAITLTAIFKGYEHFWPLLSLVPACFVLCLLMWSLATLMSFAAVHFPDTQHLLTVGLQILFYVTPVIYPPSVVNAHGFGYVLKFNPLGYVLEIVRAPIVNSQLPSPSTYGIAIGFTVMATFAAMLTLRRCERTLVFALI